MEADQHLSPLALSFDVLRLSLGADRDGKRTSEWPRPHGQQGLQPARVVNNMNPPAADVTRIQLFIVCVAWLGLAL